MQTPRTLLGTSKLTAATMIAISALALSACTNASETGPSSAATSSGSASASFDPTTVKKDDALAAMVPDAIKSKGTITVGSDTSYAPAEFLGPDGQTPVGYDVDIDATAREFGISPTTLDVWARRLASSQPIVTPWSKS